MEKETEQKERTFYCGTCGNPDKQVPWEDIRKHTLEAHGREPVVDRNGMNWNLIFAA